MYGNRYSDADTFHTSDFTVVVNDKGHCAKHPEIKIRGKDKDGYKFERDSCPKCDKEFDAKLDKMKNKRSDLDKQLYELDSSQGPTSGGPIAPSAVFTPQVNDGYDDVDPHYGGGGAGGGGGGGRRGGGGGGMMNGGGGGADLAPKTNLANDNNDDEGWTRPNKLSLEALADQMNRMQQMQDWLLMQKEQEMALLKQKVEEQQKDIMAKEIEMALLKEKLQQQEQRMQHELKLIKMAAYNNRKSKDREHRSHGRSKKHSNEDEEVKQIHIESLHVNVAGPGGGGADGNASFSQEMIEGAAVDMVNDAFNNPQASSQDKQKAIEMATRDALEHTAAAGAGGGGGAQKKHYDADSDNVVDRAPHDDHHHQDELQGLMNGNMKNPPSAFSGGAMDDIDDDDDGGDHHHHDDGFNVLPSNVKKAPPPDVKIAPGDAAEDLEKRMQAFNDEDDEEDEPPQEEYDEEGLGEESKDKFPTITPWATPGAAAATAGASQDTPQAANAAAIPPSDNDAGGLGNNIQRSNDDELLNNIDNTDFTGDVPANIDYGEEGDVPNAEEVTVGSAFASDKFNNTQRLYVPKDDNKGGAAGAGAGAAGAGAGADNTDAFTVGNTVATSTYGEDRQKVVNQTVLDPYGDSGQYTGVVLLSTGMPHGLGRMVYEDDGRTYEGDWRHGRWHGFGRATFANGDSYEGEYRFDQRHGRGLYQWADGRQYDGDFYEDKRHGRGTFKWPDGAVYEGDFVHGQREGRGRYTFSDGGFYVGGWVDGRYEGYGECTWEDGRVYKGEWQQGMAHGRGVETYANGEVRHEGLWEHDDPIRED